DEGAPVSVDLASWSAIRDSGAEAFRDLVFELAPDVVFSNEDEERIVGGPLPGARWIVKRGARGCSFEGEERAALPVEQVVDTTGAGDALAAGFIVGGPDLALETAARCVQRMGAMP
ncbi:MAG TPA: PfkB family carbohydrate kinase, partial [Gaiellaceae bacterium]|nr:PfkB family carbohydrate kinase [Gaiellaceae bacterium]